MAKINYWDLLSNKEKMQIDLLEKQIEFAKSIEEVERYKVQIGMIMAQIVKRARRNPRDVRVSKTPIPPKESNRRKVPL
ncbi:hypothetical protein [Neobacillus mesonae]|uniref:hypothetical protein n=1 Tax=Neobacillus mesonae TaxID=1193713 RepID=UPI00082CC625|nr:hypothetical protein [Neobacillus mesonae]